MISQRRRDRMEAVVTRRLARVRCAVEAVHHRHNVSAILRTCDSLGIHHVHLVGTQHLKVSPGAARGAERWLALHHHADADEAIAELRRGGFRIYVADLEADPLPPEAVPVDAPVCLWFGAEAVGVSQRARAAADGVVTLPMHGFAQSLNVSVAAALALRPVAEAARGLGQAALLSPDERDRTLSHWIEREHALRAGIALRSGGSP
ncbi:MAG TPA: TrmH family RNA methyltransferase [Deltaproteobacteria bacterium]|nr:TrmH family RNA methyltransferase [Deltaproteobacteria bacterium]